MIGRHTTAGRPARTRGQRGETLIETLVTVVVMGIAIVGTLAGLISVARLANHNAQVTHVRNSAQGIAETVKQPVGDLVYQQCGTAASYTAKLSPTLPGTSYTWVVDSVDYVSVVPDGNLSSRDAPTWLNTCSTDKGLQRLTIKVTGTGDGMTVSESITVVKRDARCIGSYPNVQQGPC